MNKLKDAGLKLNVKKFSFFTNKVEYLGYIFSKFGVHAHPDKLTAISKAPVSNNLKQVQAFTGLVNYYSRFIPRSVSIMAPFYALLKKNVQFKYTELQQQAFDQIKHIFCISNVLQHLKCDYETCLETDSSSYGVCAVL